MKYAYLYVLFIFSFVIPQGVSAYEITVSPDVSISENYISDKNLYIASVHTWFNATYEKDIVSASYDQTIKGKVFGDITALGKKVALSGETYGDVRTVADTVIVSGVVNEDLILVGRYVEIGKDAIINGDTLILAHTVDVQGQFLGSSQITANKISISGSIVGPATYTGSRIMFMNNAKLLGDIAYFSPQRAYVESGVQMQKQPVFNQIESIKQNDVIKKIFFAFVSFWAIIKLIATLFMIFILTHLFRPFVQKVTDIVLEKKLHTTAIGLFGIIIFPLLSVVLFASIVLIPISIIMFCIFMIMIILLPALSAIITAVLYQVYIQKNTKPIVGFNMSALALVVLTSVGFIPYIGSISMYILYIFSFGVITKYLYTTIRKKGVKHLF